MRLILCVEWDRTCRASYRNKYFMVGSIALLFEPSLVLLAYHQCLGVSIYNGQSCFSFRETSQLFSYVMILSVVNQGGLGANSFFLEMGYL
jgi:hypothetical protein